ncbi:MAG: hypothetical protein ACXWQ5_00770 [Ktedonobacterales bacterium]
MGNGRSKKDNFGYTGIAKATIKLDQLVKQVGINSMTLAQKTARYLTLNNNSIDRKVMDEIIKHGGGSLGAIRLRLENGGLPRNKLLDIKNVFKRLREHGLIELVVGGPNDDSAQYRSDVTRDSARRMNTLPNSILIALANGKKKEES